MRSINKPSAGRPLVAAVVPAVLLLATLAQPAAAVVSSAGGDRGAVGICTNRYLGHESRYWGGVLDRIGATPPTMYALNARTATVGWRFSVARDLPWNDKGYQRTYLSPLQQAPASTDPAAFTSMDVGVALPARHRGWTYDAVSYQITLRLFWYRADGSIQQKVTHTLVHYQTWGSDGYWWSQKGGCQGGYSAYVDGPG
jgi:hypothetical protein